MELVRTARKPKRRNPKKLMIFSNPKTGKTTITAKLTLERNWVMLDFEKTGDDFGSDFIEGVIQPMPKGLASFKAFSKLVKEHKEEHGEFPYEGIIVDSITALEELCLPYAGRLYRSSVMGSTWEETNDSKILELPNGAGYYWTRLAMKDVLSKIYELAPNVILLGHKAEKSINKKGKEVSVKEIDLMGKMKSIVSADMDAIGYMYREGTETILTFKADETSVVGGRCPHLSNEDIVIANSESGELVTFWDKVYLKEEDNEG